MKEIKVYMRPLVANRVIMDLEEAGARDMTLIRVDAIKPPLDQNQKADVAFARCVIRSSVVAKLELVCLDEEVKLFVEIIRARAHTGQRGDGRIFVSSVEGAVNIRTGETGEKAL